MKLLSYYDIIIMQRDKGRYKNMIRTDILEIRKRRQEYADREFNRKTEEERIIILQKQNRLLKEELEKFERTK